MHSTLITTKASLQNQTYSKTHYQRCHPRVQPTYSTVVCKNNSWSSDGTNEFNCAEHNQSKQSNSTKRQANSQPKLAMEFWQVRQQHDKERAPPIMPIWLLHPKNSQLGSCSKESLSQQVHSCIKNWLHICLQMRAPSLIDGPPNMHPTPWQRPSNHYAATHLWWSTMSLWMGGYFRNNLQFRKQTVKKWQMGPSHTSCLGPTQKSHQNSIYQTMYLLAKHKNSLLISPSILAAALTVTTTLHWDLSLTSQALIMPR